MQQYLHLHPALHYSLDGYVEKVISIVKTVIISIA